MAEPKDAKTVPKRKVVDIDRGLFLVRYAAAEDEENPPTVSLSLDPAGNPANVIILHPDADEAVLAEPGNGLAVRASQPARLFVEVMPASEGGSTAATVRVEALVQSRMAGEPSRPTESNGAAAPAPGLRLLAHVAGIGDVAVTPDAWVAGPSAPSRIEGISVEWPDRPSGLEVRYAVRFGGPQPSQSRMTAVGGFAGTRGRAMPITSLVLELSGGAAASYNLGVEALFLGSPIVNGNGQRVVLSGPTSREPLVGLRLSIEPTGKTRTEAPSLPAAARKKRPGRVRVFRSRPKVVRATA